MEVHSECQEPPPPPLPVPPCDPQPTGKINKAAFKLFGKRRSGSGMASFFSFRNKGANGNSENGNSVNGNSAGAANELVRSKTHDGLTSSETDGQRGEESGILEVGQVRSLSKSLSFFSLLRRGSVRTNDNSGLGRRGRGLKGFFSSIRWRRKERVMEREVEVIEGREGREVEVILTDQLKDISLTLEPCQPQETEPNTTLSESSPTDMATTPLTHSTTTTTNLSESPYTPSPSPVRTAQNSKPKASVSSVTATPPLERCCDPPSEPSVDRLCSLLFTDVTSLKSFDSLTGCGDIIADADEEGAGPVGGGNGGVGSATSSSSSSGGGGRQGGAARSPPTNATTPVLIPTSCMTQTPSCVPVPLPARARLMASHCAPSQQPAGSGVVAYMGGGEEMASPDGVDDADMQGLWHMLPSGGENSPALPRPSSHPPHPPQIRGLERKPPQVKTLGLSKIPVVGGGGGGGGRGNKPPAHGARQTSSPNEETKDEIPPQQEVPALKDEGYWDSPSATPTATPDDGFLREQRIGLLRDSCSGDALYDLYNEELDKSDEEEEDLTSTPSPSAGSYNLSPSSQNTAPASSSSSSFRSMKGSTSLPRESKIPLSVKQTSPPHSVSQSALSSALTASPPSHTPTDIPRPARTRIPVSKVPIRRPGNKPGKDTRGAATRK